MPSAYKRCFTTENSEDTEKLSPQLSSFFLSVASLSSVVQICFRFRPKAGLRPLNSLPGIIDLTEGEICNQHAHVSHAGHAQGISSFKKFLVFKYAT